MSGAAAKSTKAAHTLQVRRARGQVEGIERMIEKGRPPTEILVQITAARASLQVVAKDLLARHLESCRRTAVGRGGQALDAMYQELVDVVSKMAR